MDQSELCGTNNDRKWYLWRVGGRGGGGYSSGDGLFDGHVLIGPDVLIEPSAILMVLILGSCHL